MNIVDIAPLHSEQPTKNCYQTPKRRNKILVIYQKQQSGKINLTRERKKSTWISPCQLDPAFPIRLHCYPTLSPHQIVPEKLLPPVIALISWPSVASLQCPSINLSASALEVKILFFLFYMKHRAAWKGSVYLTLIFCSIFLVVVNVLCFSAIHLQISGKKESLYPFTSEMYCFKLNNWNLPIEMKWMAAVWSNTSWIEWSVLAMQINSWSKRTWNQATRTEPRLSS